MTEGFNPSNGVAWGCTSTAGWVPYPKDIPRRHPLLDAVGRVDDPCDRPLKTYPDYKPKPKYKPPREGYPNNMCHLEDYAEEKGEQESDGKALATINVAQGTPKCVSFNLEPVVTTEAIYADGPTPAECCSGTRRLDTLRAKYEEIVGTNKGTGEVDCSQSCNPRLPPYPCQAIIDLCPRPFLEVPEHLKCLPLSLRTPVDENAKNQPPLTGWEGIEGERTCDHYPIEENLPSRFNNAKWFKGYGCERLIHPMYLTTAADYGRFGPTPHTMTQRYYPKQCGFTEILGRTGMYRNRTLNTNSHKTKV